MKTPTKFVNESNNEQREELRQVMRTGNEQVRRRPQETLLSARGYAADQIADIYEADCDTVSHRLDRWEDAGTGGLQDQEGRGRKPTLNEKEQQQAIRIVEQDPRSSKRNLSKVEEKTGKKIGRDPRRGHHRTRYSASASRTATLLTVPARRCTAIAL